MGKIAFVFPGQGSQAVGMGREVRDASEAASAVFAAADDALGEPLSRLCFEGPEAELALTANTQPAVLTVSAALAAALGEVPDVVAGHSLGEYSAHVCAGTLALADAVRLVRARGRLMQEAVPVGAGAMAAVMGADRAAVEAACRETQGVVEPVNYNSPGQTVIAGEARAVEACSERLRAGGAKAIALPVSAPFHSSLMQGAERALAPELDRCPMSDPRIPVYANVDATPVLSAAAARAALARQVSRPVRWEETVARMVADGVTLFVELGPGKVLTGLVGRIAKDARRLSVQTPRDLDPARAAIREARATP